MASSNGAVRCPYCDAHADLVTGLEVYPRRADLATRHFWLCRPCRAWVGCHANSRRHVPLGRLANAELRSAKQAAHAAFDRLWQAKMRRDRCNKGTARRAAYRWLAERLEMDPARCHIGMMDVPDCRRVVEACRPYLAEKRDG